MSRSALLCCLLAACASESGPDSDDVIGPFTGGHRFVVDRVDVPMTNTAAREFADDLDGDGTVDNQAGMVIATLFGIGDANTHGADAVASGAVASFVLVEADDLAFDASVGVTYFGADGDPATVAGGRLEGGVFVSNRTRTTNVPGDATLVLPVFQDVAPAHVPVVGVEIDLVSDRRGGFTGTLRGGIPADVATTVVGEGVLAMIRARPQSHLSLARMVDTNHDGTLTVAEIAASSIIGSLTAPDVQLFSGDRFDPQPDRDEPDALSLGIGFHLLPCAAGNCALSTPANTCFDRVLDGTETDIDCGGECGACQDGARCGAPTDCQTGACDGGACRAASCNDGILDGLESDVDCGGNCAASCAAEKACYGDADCASNSCSTDFGRGSCQ